MQPLTPHASAHCCLSAAASRRAGVEMAQIAVCRLLAAAPAVARARLGTARPALALVPLRASSGGAGQITSGEGQGTCDWVGLPPQLHGW